MGTVIATEPVVESARSNEACVARPRHRSARGSRPEWPPWAGRTAWRSRGRRPPKAISRPTVCIAQAAGGARERIGEVAPPETTLRDRTGRAGARYVYTVTTVDTAGNESPPSQPAPRQVP